MDGNVSYRKRLGGKMLIEIELAIAAIALASLALLAAVALFYVRIAREQKEIQKIREKIDNTEESIKKMNGSLVTIKEPGHPA